METLHTKYRPTLFKEVVGQTAVVRSLKASIAKRTNRTFLMHGPSGTGKTTLARIAATTIGCRSADIQEIDAATFNGIDDMRQITNALQYRPLGGGTSKAIIIDECHALSKAAWQSLLKSLEEPPEWVWWFLCTTDVGKVPANIQTRCTKYTLGLVDKDDLLELLYAVSEAEGLPESDEWESILALCAKAAEGSPRSALVYMGACLGAQSKKEAASLLRSAEESPKAIDLARALSGNKPSWSVVRGLLVEMKDENPESVRHVVRAYMTNVILGAQDTRRAEAMFAVLEAFSTPFNPSDGMSPLVLAVGSLLLTR